MIPVRCWSCGKVIAHVYEQYKEAVEMGEDPDKTLDDLGMELSLIHISEPTRPY